MKKPIIDPTAFTEKNIRSIYAREKSELESASVPHKLARSIANFTGSLQFISVNILFFAAWIGINLLPAFTFDPYPFAGLAMVVSFEAIFLSSLVLISQNDSAKQSEARHNLNLQINLLAEEESTALLRAVIEIGRKLDIPEDHLAPLVALSVSTDANKILDKIETERDEE